MSSSLGGGFSRTRKASAVGFFVTGSTSPSSSSYCRDFTGADVSTPLWSVPLDPHLLSAIKIRQLPGYSSTDYDSNHLKCGAQFGLVHDPQWADNTVQPSLLMVVTMLGELKYWISLNYSNFWGYCSHKMRTSTVVERNS